MKSQDVQGGREGKREKGEEGEEKGRRRGGYYKALCMLP
jgi:hypothetical protein